MTSKRAYITTYTGKKVNILNIKPSDIDIVDIAHALSLLNRWAGHTVVPYSVLEHSLAVAVSLKNDYPDRPDLWLAGLLHDAAEAYCVDLPSPLKKLLPKYKRIERNIRHAIFKKYGLPEHVPQEVWKADLDELEYERSHYLTIHAKGSECSSPEDVPTFLMLFDFLKISLTKNKKGI